VNTHYNNVDIVRGETPDSLSQGKGRKSREGKRREGGGRGLSGQRDGTQ